MDNKKIRGTIKAQFTRILTKINNKEIESEEVDDRLHNLDSTWNKFLKIQDEIEMAADETELDEDINYRMEMEDTYIGLRSKLKKVKDNESDNSSSPEVSNKTNTPNITFVPFSEDESFNNFIKRFDVYLFLRNISDDMTKVFTFMNALPPTLHEKLYNICAPDNPLKMTYEHLITLLRQHLDPQPSLWARQHNFIIREQQIGESVTDFLIELRKLVTPCDFNCSCGKSTADTMLRLQFIRGLRDTDIRTHLLQTDTNKTFSDITNIAVTMELSKQENTMMSKHLHNIEMNQVDTHSKRTNRTNQDKNQSVNSNQLWSFQSLQGKCYRCGNENHKANKCRFSDNVCRKCGKTGHIARVCLKPTIKNKTKEVFQHDPDNEEEHDYEINIVSSKICDKFKLTISIDGKSTTMELDTGAALSSISFKDYQKLGLHLKKDLHKTNVELRTYTGEIIKPMGFVFVDCSYKQQNFTGKLYIIDQQVDAIFGRDWMREVKLDWADIKMLSDGKRSIDIDTISREYSDVFEDNIGLIPNVKGHIQLKDSAQPVFLKPRPLPYVLKQKVELELERLENAGIISKVEQSDWGTPIVPVVKPSGKIRICADYKATINKLVKDVNYPIPRIEDMFAKMNGAKYFCTLDIKNAYLHMSMDDESALLQTISTHKGQYKVNRLMFGIKIAPALWQRFMDQIFQDIDGVQVFFDDIIIQGSTKSETFQRLKTVLEIMRKFNLRLNKEKCKFFQQSIEYLGHTIDEKGLHKNKNKVEAILNSKQPINVSELRTFLGMANYYHKFIPDINSILNPLYKLLRSTEKFIWSAECNRSFNRIKSEIASDRILVHYNPEETLVLATDASPVGVGAVLSHRYKDGTEKPISFASRSLTVSERKYSQIDKEAMAIYWGLKKFYQYCYGRKFVLITDHKPLVSIFDPNRTLPTMTATRIFNYAHFLSGFDYTIEYRNTKDHGNADFMSRFPTEQPNNSLDEHEVYHIHQIETLPVTHEAIAKETRSDNQLSPLLNALSTGLDLKSLGLRNNEYSLMDGCIFRSSRVLIPKVLQHQVLKELHVGHLGIVKMKNIARSFCYWKGIDHDIEEMAKSCRPCCLKQNLPPKTDVHPWIEPSGPWQRLHIDFAGPSHGQYFFIIVDAYTKWVEVVSTKTTTSSWCIQQLRKLFSTFGFPLTLVSDNGTNFTSLNFETFLQNCGVTHKLSAPYHPATNGQAERFVQTVKKNLLAMENEGGDINYKICQLMMALRNAPSSTTGITPYELMFGRHIRTRLDLMKKVSKVKEDVEQKPKSIRELKKGDRVQVRNFTDRTGKWKFGTIKKKEGILHYIIDMDNGQLWRRHINHIRSCKFTRED